MYVVVCVWGSEVPAMYVAVCVGVRGPRHVCSGVCVCVCGGGGQRSPPCM